MDIRFYNPEIEKRVAPCYAVSARRSLCLIGPHLSSMRRARGFNAWNAAYTAGVITCRSALHVLHKMDSESSPFLKDAIGIKYSGWKKSKQSEHTFFQIDQERNSLLKEGKSAFLMEDLEQFTTEPRLLVGTSFIRGSEVLTHFRRWVLNEITEIEEIAQLNRRAARKGGYVPKT